MSKYTLYELLERINSAGQIISSLQNQNGTITPLYVEGATDAQKSAAQAIIDAATLVMSHRTCTPFAFYSRFTAEEMATLKASTDAVVIQWRENMQIYQEIILDGAEMDAAMSYLVSLGIITETRNTEILK